MIRGAALALAAFGWAGQAVAGMCSGARADFRWAGGQARFAVEIADDESERAQGLMFRRELSASAGMLFIYDRPQPVAFWMKKSPRRIAPPLPVAARNAVASSGLSQPPSVNKIFPFLSLA